MRLNRLRDDSGAVAILVALLLVVFLGIGALVIDLGLARDERRSAQRAADLAALAGGQDLPDRAKATASVAEYLQANGWPATSQAALTDGALANGEADVNSSATRLTVTTPARTVGFGLSGVFSTLGSSSAKSVDVAARATVEIRSLGAILPYLLPGPTSTGNGCVKNGPPGQATASPSTSTTPGTGKNGNGGGGNGGGAGGNECGATVQGNFGFADIVRTDSYANKTLEGNIRLGVQYAPSVIANQSVVASGLAGVPTICTGTNSPTGAILLDARNPQAGYTCLPSRTGNIVSVVTNALIESQNNACDGRLATRSFTGVQVSGCQLVSDRFAQLAPGGATGSGPIDGAIVNDPRFGIVPVIANDTLPLQGSSNDYAIVKFYGVYYKDFLDNQGTSVVNTGKGSSQISAVTTYIFELNRLPGILSNNGTTVTFTGVGPKIPVLVE